MVPKPAYFAAYTWLNDAGIFCNSTSRLAGRHSMRFGATFVRHQLNTNQDVASSGQIFLYQFTDFLLGQDGIQNGTGGSNLLARFASTGSFEKALRFNDFSSFVQDDWKVSHNLTLNLGLRWDFFSWPTDTRGRLAGFDTRLLAEGAYGSPPAGGTYSGYTLAQAFVQQNQHAVIPPSRLLKNGLWRNSVFFPSFLSEGV
jgi:outer membrane receptor protein involved in Fe transport